MADVQYTCYVEDVMSMKISNIPGLSYLESLIKMSHY